MRRREFITFLGSAVGWTVATHAQEATKIRRIAVLFPLAVDDPEAKARLSAFQKALARAGWVDGRNVRFDVRWSVGNDIDSYATELVDLGPDVILANGSGALAPLLKATRSVPIVFAVVPDPVGAGFVQSLAKPGTNATGFTTFEYDLSAKWLELLRQVAPKVSRVAVIVGLGAANGAGPFQVMQSASSSLGFKLTQIDIRDRDTTAREITAFAREPDGGLIGTASALTASNRDVLVALASRLSLPSVFFARHFA